MMHGRAIIIVELTSNKETICDGSRVMVRRYIDHPCVPRPKG